MDSPRGKSSPNQSSDSDNDWTLVSPPHSSSSSSSSLNKDVDPSKPTTSSTKQTQQQQHDSSEELTPNDGLTEIDLKEDVVNAEGSGRSSSTEPSIPGFKPLDWTSEDSDVSRRSSVSSSDEFPDFVRLKHEEPAQQEQQQLVLQQKTIAKTPSPSSERKRVSLFTPDRHNSQSKRLKLEAIISEKPQRSIQAKLDELSDHFAPLPASTTSTNRTIGGWTREDIVYTLKFLLGLFAFIAAIIVANYAEQKRSYQKTPRNIINEYSLNAEFDVPASHQYLELHLLQTELSLCIKRQSPSSFKYYIARDQGKSSSPSRRRALVCYGQEVEWRKRFDQLKQDLDLDLPQLLKEAKESVTNEMLTSYHPALQFKLILNQIEYLNYLEAKRKQRQSEETIKHLKAENLQMARKLSQPNGGSNASQKLVVKLELENSKLRRENEALKASLVEKAGPVYIKQAIEKDQADRENKVLKKFLLDVNKAVAWGLRRFNIHTIDASMELDNLDVVESQVASTKGYLYRLTDRVSKVLMDNESLKEQLRETHLQLHAEEMPLDSDNSSKELVLDSCVHSLGQLREKSARLEEEVFRLRRDCDKNLNVGLQKTSDRNLNRTKFGNPEGNNHLSRPIETSMDKSRFGARDEMQSSILADDIVDDMMLFLTKFNRQMERSDPNGLSRPIVRQSNSRDKEKTTTTLPNYIQEAVRVPKVKLSSVSDNGSGQRLRLPPTPPPTAHFLNQSQRPDRLAPRSLQFPTTYSYSYQRANVSRSSEQVNKSNISATSPVFPSDSWFFKRAKQRNELRRSIEQPNWAIKRAKLRKKLRTASAYMDGNDYRKNDHRNKRHKSSYYQRYEL